MEPGLKYNGREVANAYLKKHFKVDFDDCARYCSNHAGCRGFEWNPEYVYPVQTDKGQSMTIATNVCCPKRTIGEFVDRVDQKTQDKSAGLYGKYKNGHFYFKDHTVKPGEKDNMIYQW